jgi:hypothetical protein
MSARAGLDEQSRAFEELWQQATRGRKSSPFSGNVTPG